MPTDFWESLRLGFMQLRESCAIDPPIAPAGRLTAIWTAEPAPGNWRLNYWGGTDGSGVTQRFEWHAQSAAARLGCDEKEHKAVWFWLDRVRRDAPKAYTRTRLINSAFGEPVYSCEILDICGLSAEYCRKCEAEEETARRAAAPPDSSGGTSPTERGAAQPTCRGKQSRIRPSIERVKQEIRQLKEARCGQEEICKRLGDKPRPRNAAWKALTWYSAFRDPAYKNSVKSWISRV